MNTPLIELSAVAKVFAEGATSSTAIDALDLRIAEGEFVCLCGPSGCGKTTVLNLVAGLEFATRGAVRVRGVKVDGPSPERTVMFQESALFPWLTVQKNVEFPLEMAGVAPAERAQRAEKYLRMVHMWRYRDAQP